MITREREYLNLKTTSYLSIALILISLTACQPAKPSEPQPVFTPSTTEATATPLPYPSTTPRVAATLPNRIQSFDISPDLSTIALATTGGVVLYDFKTLKYLRTLNERQNAFRVAWSPDGSKLAVGGALDFGTPFYVGGDSSNSAKAHLTVWGTSSWNIVFEPDFGEDMVNQRIIDVAWSPDNRSLAFSTDLDGVSVLDTQTGQRLSHQTDFAGSVVDISWPPDGSRLVSTSDMAYSVRRWKVSNDQAVRLFDPRVSNPMQVAWSPDGKRVASGHAYGGVCIWTAATNKCDGYIQAHRTAVFSLVWSPDGEKLATGGGVIRIWDMQTGKLLTAFGENDKVVYAHIAWPSNVAPLVALETGLDDQSKTAVRYWDISTGTSSVEIIGTEP
jgi:WD40 repeat protein